MKKLIFFTLVLTALSAILNPANVHGCTSWMIFSDLTKNGTNILHKNRDATSRNLAVYLSPADSPRKWIGMGNNNTSAMGMNASGLAVIMNNGGVTSEFSDDLTRKTTGIILRESLTYCDTAAQAIDRVKNIIKNKQFRQPAQRGSIFFFCDRNEGYICEMTSDHCSFQRYDAGYAVRANILHNPGMDQRSRNNISHHLNSSARAFIAISEFNKALDKTGKITLQNIFDLSRHYLMPEESPEKRSVCFKYTNSTASFEIDKQYPNVLSTAYFTIGHPRHTVYVPIPVCVKEILPSMGNLKWSAAALKRLESLNLEAPIPPEWTKFEQDSLAEYSKAKAEARKLLSENKRAEAINLINSAAKKIWQKAEKLLNI